MLDRLRKLAREIFAQPPGRSLERMPVGPGGAETSRGPYAVPVDDKLERHDGWGPIRKRRPGEETDGGY